MLLTTKNLLSHPTLSNTKVAAQPKKLRLTEANNTENRGQIEAFCLLELRFSSVTTRIALRVKTAHFFNS
jgi:hypothetical protein